VTRQVSVTERVLAELTGVRVAAWCCRRAELVGVLRFAGQLHPIGGRVVVLATVGSLAAAVRVQRGLYEVYGCAADVLGPDSRPLRVSRRSCPATHETCVSEAPAHNSPPGRHLISSRSALRGYVLVSQCCLRPRMPSSIAGPRVPASSSGVISVL